MPQRLDQRGFGRREESAADERQPGPVLAVMLLFRRNTRMASFSLLTLNCFGVPVPSTRRRLLTLARQLDEQGASVVCLQEVQTHRYRQLLLQACTSYPASAYAPFLHAPKGGLLTLARQSVTRTQFTLYRERGPWYTPAAADWLLHKGVLATELRHADRTIVVLNTHLLANYSGDWRAANRYARAEWNQLRQLAEIVSAQPADALVLVAGDFNIPRGSWLYHEFLAASGLTDPLAGDTRPTYRLLRGMPARYALPIDFALLRAPALPGLQVRAEMRFQEKMPLLGGALGYLSDHCGIEVQLSWDDPTS